MKLGLAKYTDPLLSCCIPDQELVKLILVLHCLGHKRSPGKVNQEHAYIYHKTGNKSIRNMLTSIFSPDKGQPCYVDFSSYSFHNEHRLPVISYVGFFPIS